MVCETRPAVHRGLSRNVDDLDRSNTGSLRASQWASSERLGKTKYRETRDRGESPGLENLVFSVDCLLS